jgi:hypothetical protein
VSTPAELQEDPCLHIYTSLERTGKITTLSSPSSRPESGSESPAMNLFPENLIVNSKLMSLSYDMLNQLNFRQHKDGQLPCRMHDQPSLNDSLYPQWPATRRTVIRLRCRQHVLIICLRRIVFMHLSLQSAAGPGKHSDSSQLCMHRVSNCHTTK